MSNDEPKLSRGINKKEMKAQNNGARKRGRKKRRKEGREGGSENSLKHLMLHE